MMTVEKRCLLDSLRTVLHWLHWIAYPSAGHIAMQVASALPNPLRLGTQSRVLPPSFPFLFGWERITNGNEND